MKYMFLISLIVSLEPCYCQNSSFQLNTTLDSLRINTLSKLPDYGQVKKVTTTTRHVSIVYLQSPLFVIQSSKGEFLYKFYLASDSSKVKEFFDEYFKTDLIKSVNVFDSVAAPVIYGPQGLNGVVLIDLKKHVKFNPKVAGLSVLEKRKRRYYGSNFR